MHPHSWTRFVCRGSVAIVFAWSAVAAGATQSNWIDYTEVTGTLLVADPSVLVDDSEKQLYAADLDNDGWTDLIVGRKHPFTFEGERGNVLFMNEGGVLVDRTAQLIPGFFDVGNTRDIIAFDANGDGWLDIVEANTLYDHPRLWRNLGRDGAGTFLGFVEDVNALATLHPYDVKFCSVDAADIDGDGDLDLYFNDYRNQLEDRILINDGTGLFTDATALHMTPSAAQGHFVIDGEFADFNGDGAPDLVKVEDNTLPLRIIYNDGSGFYLAEQSLPTLRTHQAVPADFDNDGRLDLYVVDSGQDYFFMNLGNDANGQVIWSNPVFVTSSPHTTGPGGPVLVADVDRDGYVDVLVSDVDVFVESCARKFTVLRNTTGVHGTPTLEDPNPAPGQPWNTQGVFDAVTIDIDNDGYLDLVQGTCTGLRAWRMVPFSMPGTSYCTSGPNSAGTSARIHAHGSDSIAANDLRLVVVGGVPRQLGVFYYGQNAISVPFGNGVRCVGGSTSRLFPSQRMGASGGLSSRRLDFTVPPASSGGSAITPGSTWRFQFWFRDPAAGGAAFDFTDATSITFQP